jgi:hypothetical protein
LNKIIGLIAIIVLWFAYQNRSNTQTEEYIPSMEKTTVEVETKVYQPTKTFTCDGRQYCSQMTSCEEATYFLQNCPNPKMDGNHDGVPCERQWCH